MNIAICDDIASERLLISEQVNKYFPDSFLWEYEDCNDLLESHREKHFDIIFLDVLMPIKNGIETAELIRNFDRETPIVFITTTDEFAVQSYGVSAFDYILKPVTPKSMKRCASRFKGEKKVKQFITVNHMGTDIEMLLDNVIYLESELRKVNFHLVGGKSLLVVGKLEDYFDILKNREFCRCHKSFIVNLDYIGSVSSSNFIMNDETCIKISRSFLNDAKKAYFDYAFGSEYIYI